MKRQALFLAAAVMVLAAAVQTQAGERLWPNGAPTVYVGFGAGGGTDNAVRPLIAKMSEYLGETINVVNMPGAASAVAAEHVMGLPNDGYSMFATGTGCYGGFLVQDTAPNAMPWKWTGFYPTQGPAALIVNPAKSGLNTLDEALAAIKGGKANIGISGFGNGPHVMMEAFLDVAGIKDPNYVTFDSDGNVAVGVYAGEVEVGILTFSAGIDHARAGNVKVLFLNQDTPLKLTDAITAPPITEAYPKAAHLVLLSESWPLLIRRDAPKKVIDKLEEAFRWAVQQPEIIADATRKGQKMVALSGEDGAKIADYQFTGYGWILWNAGLAQKSPETAKVVKLADWNWDVEKKKYGY